MTAGTVAADRAEAGEERRRLTDYRLALGDRVEVELLVAGQFVGVVSPRLVAGTVVAGTPAALILEHPLGVDTIRIPWAAIALIRTATATHPANQ